MSCLIHFLFYCTVHYPLPPSPLPPPLSCPIHLLPINPGYGSLPIPIMSCLIHFLFYCTVYYPPPPLSCPIHLLPINPVNGSLLIPIMSCLIHFLFYCTVHYPPSPLPPIVLSHPSTSHQPWLWFTSDSHNVLSQPFRILLYSSLSPPPPPLSCPIHSLPTNPGYGSLPTATPFLSHSCVSRVFSIKCATSALGMNHLVPSKN